MKNLLSISIAFLLLAGVIFPQNILSDPPPAPVVNKAELDKQVVLDWGEDPNTVAATENYSSNGFTFQGYNVYQLPSATATKDQAIRIANYDKIDGVGNDSGVKRYIDIISDHIGGTSLVNGNNYYFAVTSYAYNPDTNAIPNNVENPIKIITVTPHAVATGTVHTGTIKNIIHSAGLAEGNITVNIIDPTKIINDQYKLFFTKRAEIRNANGDWVPSGLTKINNHSGNIPESLSGSSIDIAAVYGPQSGIIAMNCTLNLVSTDADYSDGIKLVLPAGLTIVSVPQFLTNNNDSIHPVIQGNTIILGDVNHGYSKNGPFAGGETWSILVKGNVPISTGWTIYDDGYSGVPVDASGTTTVTNIGSISRLAKYWNLLNTNTNQLKLENQSVINGTDIYPRRDDIPTNPGINAAPILDGFQVNVDVSYTDPLNFSNTILTKGPGSTTQLTHNFNTTTLDILNYTIYAGVGDSYANDNFGFGTTDINELQKDYILKFTGVWDSTKNATTGQVVHFIKSGGQMATIFRATSLATHPLNPHPGTNAPFLIRIPFEVWSKDDNRQVNLMFRDRVQAETDNPFYAWNPVNRMYAITVNSAYDSINAIPSTPDPLNALATWVLVFYGTNYTRGDAVEIDYSNPTQIGIDEYTFNPTITGIKDKNLVPLNFNLSQNYPNPFNPSTVIKFSIPKAGTVSLKIYDVLGREVRTLFNENKTQGSYSVNFNARGLSSGVYFYRLSMDDYTDVKKLVLLK